MARLSWSWLHLCFPEPFKTDPRERLLRLLEEVNELAQVGNVTREEAHALVDQVHDKPVGELEQEAGGVMVTLVLVAKAMDLDLEEAWNVEHERVMQPEIIQKIRSKQKTKVRVAENTVEA